ncbi:hypothetical protein PsW64_01768 [Pseudovibrio sp. W64]|nr:hypothetical protein PsW64_01768 [Pseudovibrio sp. W64]
MGPGSGAGKTPGVVSYDFETSYIYDINSEQNGRWPITN